MEHIYIICRVESKLQIIYICSIRIYSFSCGKINFKGGVSFLYDEPPTFERWAEKREKKIKEIESLYRYEWQKTAPRHDFVDENLPAEVAASTNLHNPFGLHVEQIKGSVLKHISNETYIY